MYGIADCLHQYEHCDQANPESFVLHIIAPEKYPWKH
jgi:hypothetical protein